LGQRGDNVEKKSDICSRENACPSPRHAFFAPKTEIFLNIFNIIPITEVNMTKADIVSEIAKTTGIDRANVLETIEKFMDVVKDSLINGENVYLRGFGSFIIKTRSEKTARNISKNTTIIIPEHKIPAFKPAKVFMEEVKK
jgi:DNA-binding protein HU-beta